VSRRPLKKLKKNAYIGPKQISKVNKVFARHSYPHVEPEYVSNIIDNLGGADPDARQEVYEMISYALNYDHIDAEGYEYIPKFLS